MSRMFDLSAGLRGIQQESQIGQIRAQAQDTAMSFYERNQNMRLKELQNERQQLLTETQLKMNEARLSEMEFDLNNKKAGQDALLAEQKLKLTKSNSMLKQTEKIKTVIAEGYDYMSNIADLYDNASKINMFADEIPIDDISLLKQKEKELFKIRNQLNKYGTVASNDAGLNAGISEWDGIISRELTETQRMIDFKRAEKMKEAQDLEIDQYMKRFEEQGVGGTVKYGDDKRISSIQMTAKPSVAKGKETTANTDQKKFEKIRSNPTSAIKKLNDFFIGAEQIAVSNPTVAAQYMVDLVKTGLSIDRQRQMYGSNERFQEVFSEFDRIMGEDQYNTISSESSNSEGDAFISETLGL